MLVPLSPALLIACACGRLSGRSPDPVVTCEASLGDGPLSVPSTGEVESIRFINSVGTWALYDPITNISSWPFPRFPSVDALASFGRRAEILFDRPAYGDLVVVWSSAVNRFVRVAIVVRLLDVDGPEMRCLSLGAHSAGGRARLDEFVPATGDRFVRWVNLERRTVRGIPIAEAA
jgi:hypothetical protein